MTTRNEKRRQLLLKRLDNLKSRMLPIQREMAFVEGELELIDSFEKAELEEAQESLGLQDQQPAASEA